MKLSFRFHSLLLSLLFSSGLDAAPGSNLDGIDLTDGATVSVDYSNQDWSAGSFIETTFSSHALGGTFLNTDFSNSVLTSARFDAADLSGAQFTNSDLTGTQYSWATLSGADFTGADLTNADFGSSSYRGWAGADVSGAVFTDATLNGASFERIRGFSVSQLNDAFDVRGMDLSHLNLTAADFSRVAASGSSTTYQHDLTGADFSSSTLTTAVFTGSNLTQANLSHSDVTSAVFTDANLTQANLDSVAGFTVSQLHDVTDARGILLKNLDLSGQDFSAVASAGSGSTNQGDLSGAVFTGSTLTGANFTGVKLNSVSLNSKDLSGANVTGTIFTDADLSHTILDGVAGFTASQLNDVADARFIKLTNLDLSGGDFSQVASAGSTNNNARNLVRAVFDGSDVTGAVFTDVSLYGASFDGVTGFSASQLNDVADAQYIKLTNLDLSGQDFSQGASSLRFSSFDNSDVNGAVFTSVNLFAASFDSAIGFNASQLNDIADARYIKLTNLDLSSQDFSQISSLGGLYGASFAGSNVSSTDFSLANLARVNFSGANVTGAVFTDANLTEYYTTGLISYPRGANFDGATGFTVSQLDDVASARYIFLKNLDLTGADFTSVATSGAVTTYQQDLTGVVFDGSTLTNAVFNGTSVANASFAGADVGGASFTDALLLSTSFRGAQNFNASQLNDAFNVNEVDLSGIDMTGQDFTQVASTGTVNTHAGEMVNANFSASVVDGADFTGVTLFNTDFRGASAVGANFTDADMRLAKLSDDDYFYANSNGLLFVYGTTPADFSQANLTNALLNVADLSGVNLDGATLSGADLTDATLRNASLDNVVGFNASQLANAFNVRSIKITNTDLTGQDFSQVASLGSATDHALNMEYASFAGSTLTNVIFTDVDLSYARFDNAVGFDASILNDAARAYGISVENVDLTGQDFSGVASAGVTAAYAGNLNRASFAGSTVTGVNFQNVSLNSANFDSAVGFDASILNDASDVRAIRLSNLDLSGQDFSQVASLGASSSHAVMMSNVSFANSTLTNASFQGVSFSSTTIGSARYQYGAGANFSNADITGVNFEDADLSTRQNFYPVSSAYLSGLNNYYYSSVSFDGVIGFSASQLDNAANVEGLKLTNLDLTGADFSQVASLGAVTANAGSLKRVAFDHSNVTSAVFTDTSLEQASFDSVTGFTASQLNDVSNARGIRLVNLDLSTQDFSDIGTLAASASNAHDLTGADIIDSNVTGAHFTDAILEHAHFNNLTGFTVSQLNDAASARYIELVNMDLTGADFSDVASAGAVTAHAGDLSGAEFAGSNLTNAVFDHTNLSNAQFAGAVISGATFTDGDLNRASFSNVTGFDISQLNDVFDARGINFSSMDLRDVDFTQVASQGSSNTYAGDLTGARFVGAQLDRANFEDVNLTDADFRWATLADVVFTNSTLAGATFEQASVATISFGGIGGSATVRSSLIVTETLTVEAGSTFVMEGTDALTLKVPVFNLSAGALFELNQHRLEVVTFNGDLVNLNGTYAPGNSPAASTINGNWTEGAAGTVEFEIAGLTPGTGYDTVHVTGDAIIDGIVELILLDGFNLGSAAGFTFDFLDVDGTFTFNENTQFILPGSDIEGVLWDTSLFGTDGTITLTAVPEPKTYALFAGLLAIGVAVVRCRTRR